MSALVWFAIGLVIGICAVIAAALLFCAAKVRKERKWDE